MSKEEMIWTNILYPQYQLYEHRLNNFIDRSQLISLHQNDVTFANAGLFYSGNGDIVVCAFLVFIFTDGFQKMSHLQTKGNLTRIVNYFF